MNGYFEPKIPHIYANWHAFRWEKASHVISVSNLRNYANYAN